MAINVNYGLDPLLVGTVAEQAGIGPSQEEGQLKQIQIGQQANQLGLQRRQQDIGAYEAAMNRMQQQQQFGAEFQFKNRIAEQQAQQEQQRFQASQMPSQKDVWQSQQQEQADQRHYKLQAELGQTQLNQAEQMRLQRVQQAIAAIQNSNIDLTDQEKGELIMQASTGIDQLQRRATQAGILQHQAQTASLIAEAQRAADMYAGAEQDWANNVPRMTATDWSPLAQVGAPRARVIRDARGNIHVLNQDEMAAHLQATTELARAQAQNLTGRQITPEIRARAWHDVSAAVDRRILDNPALAPQRLRLIQEEANNVLQFMGGGGSASNAISDTPEVLGNVMRDFRTWAGSLPMQWTVGTGGQTSSPARAWALRVVGQMENMLRLSSNGTRDGLPAQQRQIFDSLMSQVMDVRRRMTTPRP